MLYYSGGSPTIQELSKGGPKTRYDLVLFRLAEISTFKLQISPPTWALPYLVRVQFVMPWRFLAPAQLSESKMLD